MKKVVFLVLLIIVVGFACAEKPYTLSGRTMGTTYHITVLSTKNPESLDMTAKINQRLEDINRSMSLFDDQSELTRFNAAKPAETICVSDDFIRVFQTGKTLHRLTDGAWDASMGPLVNLWGFGRTKESRQLPTDKDIARAMAQTGYDQIDVTGDDACLVKKKPGLVLDFGSIAKGYAVDVITDVLVSHGFENCLVEIGGEVRASGNKGSKNWVVGINTPSPSAPADQVMLAIDLVNTSIATSGDYRNFRNKEGKNYTHVIDPSTGHPLENGVASVSVLSESATFSDGLATALMVMGEERGLLLVNGLDGVECLFILRADDGTFSQAASSGWPVPKVRNTM